MEPLFRVRPVDVDTRVERGKALLGRKPLSRGEIRRVAREFEGLFLEYLLKTMRRSIPKSGLFEHGQSEEIYTYLFDQALAERMAQRGIGLADLIQRQLELQLDPKVHKVDMRI